MGDLVAVSIIEQDAQGGVQCVWTYPAIDAHTEQSIVNRAFARTNLKEDDTSARLRGPPFSKFKHLWQYFSRCDANPVACPLVNVVAVCVLSRTFNPPKYGDLAELLLNAYVEAGNPVDVLTRYLDVTISKRTGAWRSDDFDDKQALIGGASLVEGLVAPLGLSTTLLWLAVLLKRRVGIFAEDASRLAPLVATVPRLTWSRQDWSIVRPFVTHDSIELAELKATGVFVAGFSDPSMKKYINTPGDSPALFDIIVDLPSRQVIVDEACREDFRVSEVHKAVATFIQQSADSNMKDAEFIKGLFQRSSKIVSFMKAVAAKDPSMRDLDSLAPPASHRFITNLAVAEGIELKNA